MKTITEKKTFEAENQLIISSKLLTIFGPLSRKLDVVDNFVARVIYKLQIANLGLKWKKTILIVLFF